MWSTYISSAKNRCLFNRTRPAATPERIEAVFVDISGGLLSSDGRILVSVSSVTGFKRNVK